MADQPKLPGQAWPAKGGKIPKGPSAGRRSGMGDCAAGIAAAFRGRGKLNEDEIGFITDELRRRFQHEHGEFQNPDKAWNEIAKKLAMDINEAARVERRDRRANAEAKRKLLELGREAARRYGDASLGIEALAVGLNHYLPGNRKSVDAMQEGLFQQYVGGIIGELRSAGLLKFYNSGDLDLEIARALEKKTKDTARGSTDEAANQIAEIIHKYRLMANENLNNSGGWRKFLKGFIASQNWDIRKVRKMGQQEFIQWVKPLLDHDATFGDANPDTFLAEAWKTMANGEQLSFKTAPNDLKLAFKGPANLGRKVSQHRVLHFKDADAWMEANHKIGSRSLREAIGEHFRMDARNTAIMTNFGNNPRSMFNEVSEQLRREFAHDPTMVDKLERPALRWYMDTILGDADQAHSINLATYGSFARNWISMAKLGAAMASSISDIVFKGAAIRYQTGEGILSSYAKGFTSFFDGMGRNAKEVGDLIGAGIDGHSAAIARFMGPDSRPGTASNMMRLFFKLNLLTPWTDANKRGIGMLVSRHLASISGMTFDELPEHARFILSQYEITPAKWNVIRQATARMSDGRTYLMPDMLRRIDSEEFIKHGLDPATDRQALETAVRSYFVDAQEMAVPSPGAKERALLTGGMRAGTPLGEAARFITQFKSFPVTVLTKQLGRHWHGHAPDGSRDLGNLAMMMATSLVMGYAAMTAKDVLKGRSYRDPNDYKTWIAAFVQAGGAGIYGDFLLGETNRFGRSMLDSAAGPGLGILSDIDELRARLMFGDDTAATALRLAMNNTPYLNLFYTRTALDYLVLYNLQEMANPGYLRRMEKRLLKDQGQTFILPRPSTVIPRGGGLPNF